MEEYAIERIPVKNLLVSTENPRFDPVANQREALSTIAHDQGLKLVTLAEHMLERGVNPSDLPIVAKLDDSELYTVLEGNRRITALKMLTTPGLAKSLALPSRLVKRWAHLEEQLDGTNLSSLRCVVMTPEDAREWIGLKHTGENEGVGIVSWDGRARHRFRGNSPALQAIDLVDEAGYLDEDTKSKLPKISITNIERVLSTPDARRLLGVDVRGGTLVIDAERDETLGRLALLVMDIAHKHMKVTDLDSKSQRVAYAEQLAKKDLPAKKPQVTVSDQSDGSGTDAPRKKQKQSADRTTLIPKKLKLSIAKTRLNQMYDELQKLDINKYPNSGAVMLRVFVELSIDEFAANNKISLKALRKAKKGTAPPVPLADRTMTLREKIGVVADYLEKNGVCTAQQLHGIRTIRNNKEHVLSVDSWNAYVHNQHYSPVPTDLKANWDSIEAFVVAIWGQG